MGTDWPFVPGTAGYAKARDVGDKAISEGNGADVAESHGLGSRSPS